ncbi:hypothetical protein NUW58_g2568 [Xylaria curta]|uniref:Uncharacterized protein n=1 Tax=Xylaria curta TaxID=42375 RepID=A0ACC1PHB7_9PEZI|nr:hypothetical protein NUW58_g2568 [Xylaria curta]
MSFLGPAPEPPTELGRYRILSPSAGIRVSPLCLGAMSIGSAWNEVMGSMNKKQSFELLDAYFEKGGNFIDTANDYQHGQSERWLGEWMAARKNRDRLVLATKFTTEYKSHEYGKGKVVNFSGNHKKSLHLSLRDSLEKLQTDYIDILYLHWWDWTTSIEEIMDALHIMCCQHLRPAHGKTPFVIYQGRWNAIIRDFERDIIPMARHFGMALAPWDVLGQGKFKTPKEVEERQKSGEPLRSNWRAEQTENEIKISDALAKVAAEHDVESITAIALAYIFYKYPYVYPIIGGRKISHLEDNIQSLSIKLTEKQVEYLESVTTFDIGFPQTLIGPEIGEIGKPKVMPYLTGAGQLVVVRNAQSLHRA